MIPHLKSPQGPKPGASFTTREVVLAWNTQTGMSGNNFTQNGSTDAFGQISFRLDDCANLSAFSALFDQYRIERVKLTFRSRNPATFVANTASPNSAVPWGVIVVDRDDSTAPTTLAQLQQYENAITFTGCDSFTVDLVPSLTPSVFSAAVLGGYSLRDSDSTWLDMANPDIISYGVKWGVSALTLSTSSAWRWDVFGEYIVSFRKSR